MDPMGSKVTAAASTFGSSKTPLNQEGNLEGRKVTPMQVVSTILKVTGVALMACVVASLAFIFLLSAALSVVPGIILLCALPALVLGEACLISAKNIDDDIHDAERRAVYVAHQASQQRQAVAQNNIATEEEELAKPADVAKLPLPSAPPLPEEEDPPAYYGSEQPPPPYDESTAAK